jgi:hypothetical protein
MNKILAMDGGIDSYSAAVKYLKSIGQYDRYANSSENDGFSIIYAANYQFQKRNPTKPSSSPPRPEPAPHD